MPLITPTPATLKKYGLSLEEWQAMADAQDHKCFVCQQEPKKGRLNCDHEHVFRWKWMKPEERKLFCRGLLCYTCNYHHLGRSMTIAKAQRIIEYLQAYLARRPTEIPVAVKPKKKKKIKKGKAK
jgi:Recombination endonuclease VII